MTQEEHKALGVNLFNATWELLDLQTRTKDQDTEMIHTAHASAYHWRKAGGSALNQARSHWQISRVYAVLQMGESALYHGMLSLTLCQEQAIGDFDLAFGYEAVARAYSVLGDEALKAENKAAALAACEEIAKQEDRDYAQREIHTIV